MGGGGWAVGPTCACLSFGLRRPRHGPVVLACREARDGVISQLWASAGSAQDSIAIATPPSTAALPPPAPPSERYPSTGSSIVVALAGLAGPAAADAAAPSSVDRARRRDRRAAADTATVGAAVGDVVGAAVGCGMQAQNRRIPGCAVRQCLSAATSAQLSAASAIPPGQSAAPPGKRQVPFSSMPGAAAAQSGTTSPVGQP